MGEHPKTDTTGVWHRVILISLAGIVASVSLANDNRPAPCKYPDCPPVRGSEEWLCENVSVFFCRDAFPTLPNLNPKSKAPKPPPRDPVPPAKGPK
jgi:hypothetical protein